MYIYIYISFVLFAWFRTSVRVIQIMQHRQAMNTTHDHKSYAERAETNTPRNWYRTSRHIHGVGGERPGGAGHRQRQQPHRQQATPPRPTAYCLSYSSSQSIMVADGWELTIYRRKEEG